MRKKRLLTVIIPSVLLLLIALLFVLWYFDVIPKKVYYAEDFGIEPIYSSVDYNGNGVDDYTDIVLGARIDAKNHPTYDGTYYQGGYPPDDIGVCTDVVWRAFKNAGYCLRDMVDNDIALRLDAYTNIQTPDSNIDFRRVKNLRVYFEKYAVKLTCDIDKIEEWQPGDIVIFGDDKHIGIISDKRNRHGHPYVIHNGGQKNREEDTLQKSDMTGIYSITGHYRFDASRIDSDKLVSWT